MDDRIGRALERGGLIDMTTIGRRSGEPRRIEIAFHNLGGRIYISGLPRPKERAWLANLRANPKFTFHLKGAVRADVPAWARVVTDEAERRAVLREIIETSWHDQDLEAMVAQSPLVEVTLEDRAA